MDLIRDYLTNTKGDNEGEAIGTNFEVSDLGIKPRSNMKHISKLPYNH